MSQWDPPPPPPDGGESGLPPIPPTAPPPGAVPPPGAYSRPPAPPTPPGQDPRTPQYGTPQYGTPQYGTPQYGTYQPPAAPYQYGQGLATSAVLASPGRRIGGYLIDLVILFIGLGVVWVAAIAVMGSTATTSIDNFGGSRSELSGAGAGVMLAAYAVTFLVPVLYQVVFVALKGQTPGAMLVKVKVVRLSDGQTPGWGPAIMRWLPNLAGALCSILTLALWIWALVNLFNNELRQTPFDLAAKTVVIDAG